jgi:hypothetical protein
MPIADPDSFVDFVGQQAGDSLRMVLFSTPDSYHIAYARDDLRDTYTGGQADEIVAYMRAVTDPEMPDPIKETTGELESLVLTFEHAVGIVLPVTDGNVLVSLDPTAASQLHDFTSSCQEFLTDEG